MSDWQEGIAKFLHKFELQFDTLKNRLHQRFSSDTPLMILPYHSYGSIDKLYLKGRVLADKGITSAEDDDSIWENLLNMYRRFQSDEVPFARLVARFQNTVFEMTANDEGFFEGWIDPPNPLASDQAWWEVELELIHPPQETPVTATARVYVPPPQAQFGVISDIDDTVLQTGAASMLKMARTVFLGNARTRLPFKGAAAFYRALFNGIPSARMNPLFYVSSSPWNLYDLLCDFFHLQDIPEGPVLFLRDWGLTETELLPIDNRDHKIGVCRNILDMYPSLSFILVGDSSQQDPEIYHELVSLYPERILAVYIRNVSTDLDRPKAIQKLAEEVLKAGSTLILADDTLPMAKHAIEQGWINPSAFPEIKAEKRADEAPPTPVEKILGDESQKEAPTVKVEGEKPVDQVSVEPEDRSSDLPN